MLSFINRVFVVVLLGQIVMVSSVSAQTTSSATSTTEAQKLGLPAVENTTVGELRCEPYLGSAPIKGTLSLPTETVIAGAELSFSVSFINQTERPFTNLDTYLLIVRQDGISAGTIVEYTALEQGTILAGKQTKEFSHIWTVPNNLPAGVYYPVLHASENGIPVLGDSLTINVPEGEQRFEVAAAESTAVSFDTTKSQLNKDLFSHGALTVFIQENEQNTVSVVLQNTDAVVKTIPLQWNQYANTVTNDNFRRNTKTELISLAAGEVKTVTYTVQNQLESVLLVTATISDGQTKSILGFPLNKHGGAEIVLLATGLSDSPEPGKDTTMFACVRATGELKVANATVLLTLKDETGSVLQTHTYSGDVKGIATGVGKSFSLERAYQSLTLTTSISMDGAPAREYTQVYDCEALGIACPYSAEAASLVDLLLQYKYIILGLLTLLIGVGAYLFRRRAPVVVVALLLGLSAFSALPGTTEAKGVTWNADLNTGYSDYTLDTSVSYYATIRNQSAGNTLVSDGGTVAVGDVITIEVSPFSGTDIRWVPEGTSGPYMYPSFAIVNPGTQRTGYFISGAGQPSNICTSDNIALESTVSAICIGHSFWGSGGGDGGGTCIGSYSVYGHFTPISIAPPSYTINNTGTAGLSCNVSGSQCTVTSPGTISSQISFAATTAKIYPYRTTSTPGECALSNYVMAVLDNTVPAQVINFSFTANALIPINTPPNPPTITGPTVGNPNTSYGFTVTATDYDNDQIYYQVDWNNDGVADQRLPSSGLVNSGAGQSANYSWAIAGAKTFQARTVDSLGNVSTTWTTHTITLSVLPATADLKISNSDGPLSLNIGSSAVISWSSMNAASCAIYGADLPSGALTGQAASGSYTISSVTNSDNYVVMCDGANDQVSLTVVNTSPPPPSTSKPNFNEPIISYTPSAGFNAATGEYDSIDVTFQTTNNGQADTTSSANYQFQFDRGSNGYEVTTTGSLGLLNINQSISRTETVSGGITFGANRIRVFVDSGNNVDESDEADNVRVLDFTLGPPNPNIELNADRLLVRNGEKVTLTWNTKVSFPMTCQVFGPGITTINFDPSVNGATGNQQSGQINAKSVFTLSCVVAGTTFTDTVTIETQGVIEEI